jgi:hypothetical protein
LAQRGAGFVHVGPKDAIEVAQASADRFGQKLEGMQLHLSRAFQPVPKVADALLGILEHLAGEIGEQPPADGLPDAVEFAESVAELPLKFRRSAWAVVRLVASARNPSLTRCERYASASGANSSSRMTCKRRSSSLRR